MLKLPEPPRWYDDMPELDDPPSNYLEELAALNDHHFAELRDRPHVVIDHAALGDWLDSRDRDYDVTTEGV